MTWFIAANWFALREAASDCHDLPYPYPAPRLPPLPALAAQRGAAGARARDSALAERLRVPAVRDARGGRSRGNLLDARTVPPVARPAAAGSGGAALARDSGGAAVRAAGREGRGRVGGVRPRRDRAAGNSCAEGGVAGG